MRKSVFILVLIGAASPPNAVGAAAPTGLSADLTALEQAWNGCVREAFARQPAVQSRAGSQRNALDECKPYEDAFVAARMAEDGAVRRGNRSLPDRAKAWAATVAAYVMDPLTSWIELRRR
ncbi:hypothetical protein [Methylobacterium trifolii]|uniref:Uncharacterized protein n=1 Tax=Methylobacterium trifolii TaxID=1003092 RepID=A0ABQ4TZL1_9HYPH|nr:hypothetical protein [Methylobacterium trifolii]GJE60004.1 hypothetical protein MPOCJGCO_2113 [Methylobacterium trifolii]